MEDRPPVLSCAHSGRGCRFGIGRLMWCLRHIRIKTMLAGCPQPFLGCILAVLLPPRILPQRARTARLKKQFLKNNQYIFLLAPASASFSTMVSCLKFYFLTETLKVGRPTLPPSLPD